MHKIGKMMDENKGKQQLEKRNLEVSKKKKRIIINKDIRKNKQFISQTNEIQMQTLCKRKNLKLNAICSYFFQWD